MEEPAESSPCSGAAMGPFAGSTCCESGEGAAPSLGSAQQSPRSQRFWERRKELACFHAFWGPAQPRSWLWV